MNFEEKVRYHCQLVVEYKDVDAIFSQKNAELAIQCFVHLLSSTSSQCSFSLFSDFVKTVFIYSTQTITFTKQQQLLIQSPSNSDDFIQFFQYILENKERAFSIVSLVFHWFKSNSEAFTRKECKESFYTCLEYSLKIQAKTVALESCLILLKFFENDNDTTEELHLAVIALLTSLGANELVRTYNNKTMDTQTKDSQQLRQYNVLLSHRNDRNSELIESFRNENLFENYPENIRKNIKRLFALNLARLKRNNEAKEILEQLADEYITEKNTKEYLKIHNDIVSIIPNENVEKFASYLDTIEQLFEQSYSTDYLLTLYAKKHEYAKLLNKYEAVALAKSFLLASSVQSNEFLEEVAFQLSELAKKRNKSDQAYEFLTISTNAKTAVFESRIAFEQQKNQAEKLVLEYFGTI